jgi:tRNA nucleotidyltransferase/poly(A) polymerase
MNQPELLKERILSDRYNALIFKTGEKHGIYLVGGYIRDFLRGVNAQDRDFLVSNDMNSFLRKLRKSIPGKSIVFKKGEVVRFVVRGGMHFDFSPILGTLQENLAQRDFSINAIAWSPEEGIVDFHQGIADLRKRTVQTLSGNNLVSDPVRMLRAYRFAAEIHGRIDAYTRKIIKSIHHRIKDSSSERITLELFNLLNHISSAKYLKNALSDGVLKNIFLLNLNTLKENIQSVSEFEELIKKDTYQEFKEKLKQIYSQNLTYKGLLALELIASRIGIDDLEKSRIRMSKKIKKRLLLYSKGLDCLEKKTVNDEEKIFHLFYLAKESSSDILLTKNMISRLEDYKRYIRIWKGGKISTNQIRNISGVQGGKAMGKLLFDIRKEEFLRKINSIKDVKTFMKDSYK